MAKRSVGRKLRLQDRSTSPGSPSHNTAISPRSIRGSGNSSPTERKSSFMSTLLAAIRCMPIRLRPMKSFSGSRHPARALPRKRHHGFDPKTILQGNQAFCPQTARSRGHGRDHARCAGPVRLACQLASEPSGREQICLGLDERGPAFRGEKEAQNPAGQGNRANRERVEPRQTTTQCPVGSNCGLTRASTRAKRSQLGSKLGGPLLGPGARFSLRIVGAAQQGSQVRNRPA
jgi:hypothetical protein